MHEPAARNVIGPDGRPSLHVACGANQGACFELAGKSCPYGYDFVPVFDPHDNNFLVSCHAVPTVAAEAVNPWPPPSPWPVASATTGPISEPPATIGTRNDSQIDLGY